MEQTGILEKVRNKKIDISTSMETILFTKDKDYFHATTGEFFSNRVDMHQKYKRENIFLVKMGVDKESAVYIKYHDDLDLVSISLIAIFNTMPDVSSFIPRYWEEEFTLWVNPKKEMFYVKDNDIVFIKTKEDLPYDFNKSVLETEGSKNSILSEFAKLLKSSCEKSLYFIKNNECKLLKTMDTLIEFLFYKDIEKEPTPKQELINTLSSKINTTLTFSDIEEKIKSHILEPFMDNNYYSMAHEILCYKLEKIEDGICVLRIFYCNKIYKISEEILRIFITKNETITSRKNYKKEFVNMEHTLPPIFFRKFASISYEINPSDIKNTILEYYKDFVIDIPNVAKGELIYNLFNYPVFEKLYKIGLGDYINHIYKSYMINYNSLYEIEHFANTDIYDLLDLVFDINKEKESNALGFIGLNSYQLKKVKENFLFFDEKLTISEQIYPVSEIKKLIGNRNISNIDNDTFNLYFDFYCRYCNYKERKASFRDIVDVFDKIRNTYSPCVLQNMISKIFVLATNSIEGEKLDDYKNTYPALGQYIDYVRMVSQIGGASVFKASFDNIEDVKNMHDNITALYNSKKHAYAAKNFEKLKEKWKKFIYKNNDFQIVIPLTPDDIAREGIELKHCVKSYIQKVSNGETNIVFIRKTSDLDTPFFTVEISNDGFIEQVHGMCNKNAFTEEGLEDFIDEWKEKIKLKSVNYNKMR